MLKIEDIEAEWGKDCIINESNLAEEAAKIPKLHHKYYQVLVRALLQLKKQTEELKVLERDKYLYYTGNMTVEEINERKWEQFDRVLAKMDVDRFLEADRDVIEAKLKCGLIDEKVNYLKSIISNINNRNYLIRSMLDWLRFSNGG